MGRVGVGGAARGEKGDGGVGGGKLTQIKAIEI